MTIKLCQNNIEQLLRANTDAVPATPTSEPCSAGAVPCVPLFATATVPDSHGIAAQDDDGPEMDASTWNETKLVAIDCSNIVGGLARKKQRKHNLNPFDSAAVCNSFETRLSRYDTAAVASSGSARASSPSPPSSHAEVSFQGTAVSVTDSRRTLLQTRNVSFATPLLSQVYSRPSTDVRDLALLYYSSSDEARFRKDYRHFLLNGFDVDELLEESHKCHIKLGPNNNEAPLCWSDSCCNKRYCQNNDACPNCTLLQNDYEDDQLFHLFEELIHTTTCADDMKEERADEILLRFTRQQGSTLSCSEDDFGDNSFVLPTFPKMV